MMPLNLSRREQVLWVSLFSAFLLIMAVRSPAFGPAERGLFAAGVLAFFVVFTLRHLRIRGKPLLSGWQD